MFKIIYGFCMGFMFVSCNEGATIPSKELEHVHFLENEIIIHELTALGDHPNKQQMEWYLNNYEEDFALRTVGDTYPDTTALAIYSFVSIINEDRVDLHFYNSQAEALAMAQETSLFDFEGELVNGAVLVIIGSHDSRRYNKLATWFAGEE